MPIVLSEDVHIFYSIHHGGSTIGATPGKCGRLGTARQGTEAVVGTATSVSAEILILDHPVDLDETLVRAGRNSGFEVFAKTRNLVCTGGAICTCAMPPARSWRGSFGSN